MGGDVSAMSLHSRLYMHDVSIVIIHGLLRVGGELHLQTMFQMCYEETDKIYEYKLLYIKPTRSLIVNVHFQSL